MQSGPTTNLRFETKAQRDRIARAAKIRKWSINTFMLQAAELLVTKTLETDKTPEQLMVEPSQLTLNQ